MELLLVLSADFFYLLRKMFPVQQQRKQETMRVSKERIIVRNEKIETGERSHSILRGLCSGGEGLANRTKNNITIYWIHIIYPGGCSHTEQQTDSLHLNSPKHNITLQTVILCISSSAAMLFIMCHLRKWFLQSARLIRCATSLGLFVLVASIYWSVTS